MTQDPDLERRAFVMSYAVAAVKSGRLTPRAAVEEALAEWAIRQDAEGRVAAVVAEAGL